MTRHWRIFDGDVAILDVWDRPGALTSTAPPMDRPALHPFLSAAALDAAHEHVLRELLLGATTTDEFITALAGAGFRVVAS